MIIYNPISWKKKTAGIRGLFKVKIVDDFQLQCKLS